MMKGILIITIYCLFWITNLTANDTIKITIVNTAGEPVSNVLIREINGSANNGYVSNEQGSVSVLLRKKTQEFLASHICYPSQKIKVSNLEKTVIIKDYDFCLESTENDFFVLGVYKGTYHFYSYKGYYGGDRSFSGIIKTKSKTGTQNRFVLDANEFPDIVIVLNEESQMGFINNLPKKITKMSSVKIELRNSNRYCE